eukprot:14663-Prymnesium_polylepis.3
MTAPRFSVDGSQQLWSWKSVPTRGARDTTVVVRSPPSCERPIKNMVTGVSSRVVTRSSASSHRTAPSGHVQEGGS